MTPDRCLRDGGRPPRPYDERDVAWRGERTALASRLDRVGVEHAVLRIALEQRLTLFDPRGVVPAEDPSSPADLRPAASRPARRGANTAIFLSLLSRKSFTRASALSTLPFPAICRNALTLARCSPASACSVAFQPLFDAPSLPMTPRQHVSAPPGTGRRPNPRSSSCSQSSAASSRRPMSQR